MSPLFSIAKTEPSGEKDKGPLPGIDCTFSHRGRIALGVVPENQIVV
jgi:hypothetical protein